MIWPGILKAGGTKAATVFAKVFNTPERSLRYLMLAN